MSVLYVMVFHVNTSDCILPELKIFFVVRFVAFPLTEYDEVLSGYQPGQMVEW
jgi:hypothetical protein